MSGAKTLGFSPEVQACSTSQSRDYPFENQLADQCHNAPASRSCYMKVRLMNWAVFGFIVAGFWGVFASVVDPRTLHMILAKPSVWFAACISCPILFFAHQVAIRLSWVLIINAITYALLGMLLEGLWGMTRNPLIK
jgi:hypothetical protein